MLLLLRLQLNCRKIFDLLEEREALWVKMKELDQRANDPDRFHNRGGQLLVEEKDRKTTNKVCSLSQLFYLLKIS